MPSGRVFVIAEAGVNHNGDLELARRMVSVAKDAGADAIKFQSFRADALVVKDAPKAEYQKETTGTAESQHQMLRKLELSADAHRELVRECRAQKIEFMSTPFDESSADLLEKLGVVRFKIPSGEITNLLLLRHVARKMKPVILSTGMSAIEDVDAAMRVLKSNGAKDITLLHCISDYPTQPRDANLRVMETLSARFKVPVGFSDHTPGTAVAIAAAARGAAVIEKHFTTDRGLAGPDHRASLEPGELGSMIRAIREVEVAIGDGKKRMTKSEEATQRIARKSLVAAEDLPAGTVLEERHLRAKRPASGISPMQLATVVGRKLRSAVGRDTLLQKKHLK